MPAFSFERALYYLDRHRYDKAVKYFRLATEKEPGKSGESLQPGRHSFGTGRFQESNQVLMSVLEEVDPDLYECSFYWNNAATWAIWNKPKNICCNI